MAEEVTGGGGELLELDILAAPVRPIGELAPPGEIGVEPRESSPLPAASIPTTPGAELLPFPSAAGAARWWRR